MPGRHNSLRRCVASARSSTDKICSNGASRLPGQRWHSSTTRSIRNWAFTRIRTIPLVSSRRTAATAAATDEQNGRSGFDWAEGSGLTTMAGLLDQYGPVYHSPNGWSVRIDGVSPGEHLVLAASPPIENPVFDFADGSAPGWSFDGDIVGWPKKWTRLRFGNQNLPFIGTGEDGKGSYNDDLTGTILSPVFTTTRAKIKLLVGGGAGEGVYVELIDEHGKRLYFENGRNSEAMDERTWDVRKFKRSAPQNPNRG